MNKKKQEFFNNLANSWDRLHNKDNHNRLEEVLAKLNIPKGSTILDLGCGTGIISERLLKLTGKKGEVFACDFSIGMLKVAKKKTKDIIFVCADACNLPFRDKFFDYVVCFSCFPHFDNKQNFLKETHRVLKKEGSLVISHLLSSKEIDMIHRRIKGAVNKDKMPSKKWFLINFERNNFKIQEFIDKQGLFLCQAKKIEGLY